MRILEVRDGFIKFETSEKISLSTFIQINDEEKSYIAQIIQIKRGGEQLVVYAKILYLYNNELFEYDNTSPSLSSEITKFSFKNLDEIFETKKPVRIGKLINDDTNIILDKDAFDKKTFFAIDTPETCNIVINNLKQELSIDKKVLVVDMQGILSKTNSVAGIDFKLPLNTEAFEFLYEECLNDATSDSKSLIKEIFKDLSDYSKTVSFVPFNALKAIVDDMVNNSHIFKLIVLKNKLERFEKQGYFAATKQEAENIYKIINSKDTVIDLSKLDNIFQNRYLNAIYTAAKELNEKPHIILISNNNITKQNLKTACMDENIATTLVVNSKFKYTNDIKEMFENFVIEPSFVNNEIFKTYATFLNTMPKNTYLVVGKGTNRLPLVSTVEELPATEVTEEISIEDNEESRVNPFENLEEEFKDAQTQAIEKKAESLIEKSALELEIDASPDSIDSIFTEEIETVSDDSETIEVSKENEEILEEILSEENEEETTITEASLEIDNLESEEIIEDSAEIIENETEEEDSLLLSEEEILTSDSIEPDVESIEDNETQLVSESELEENLEIIDENFDTTDSGEVQEFHTQVDTIQAIEIPAEISDYADEIEEDLLNEDEQSELNETEVDEIEEFVDSEKLEEIPDEEIKIITLEDNNDELEEIVELDPDSMDENDIVIEIDDVEEELLASEDLEKEIVEDVDKVFTSIKEDTISYSDLDFIDELNGETANNDEEELSESDDSLELSDGMEELTGFAEEAEDDLEEGFLSPLEEMNDSNSSKKEPEILETRNNATPMVPVYDAEIPQEDKVESDPIEQGDTVVHAKYGTGVVEKMIKYGAKTLYSINFDNIGRRLLDPTLTELKKN